MPNTDLDIAVKSQAGNGKPKICKLVTIFSLALFSLAYDQNSIAQPKLEINLVRPSWTFDVTSAPLEKREAKLDPSESGLATTLRPLLDSGDYQGVTRVIAEQTTQGQSFSPALNHILGQVYMTLEDFDRAELAFVAAVADMPDFARAHQLLGLIYLQKKEYENARKHLSRAITLGISDAQTFGQLAFVNLENHSPWSAISGYQQALLLDPSNRQWQQGLLYALINAKNFSAAQALVDEMLEVDPENRTLWLQSSNIALTREDSISALTRLEIALLLGPSDPANEAVAASLHLQHGSTARAVELLLGDMAGDGNYFNLFEETAGWLVYRKQWDLAERLLTDGLDTWADLSAGQESRLIAHLGAISLARGQDGVAAKFLLKAIEGDPVNGQALLSLAELQGRRGKYIQASLFFTRAAALEGFTERALLSHAQLAIDQQDYDQALLLLRKAYRRNPAREDLNQNIKTLERIALND